MEENIMLSHLQLVMRRHWAAKLCDNADMSTQRQRLQLGHTAGSHRPGGDCSSKRAEELPQTGRTAG